MSQVFITASVDLRGRHRPRHHIFRGIHRVHCVREIIDSGRNDLVAVAIVTMMTIVTDDDDNDDDEDDANDGDENKLCNKLWRHVDWRR